MLVENIPFSIDAEDGILYTDSLLDRETKSSYRFVVGVFATLPWHMGILFNGPPKPDCEKLILTVSAKYD